MDTLSMLKATVNALPEARTLSQIDHLPTHAGIYIVFDDSTVLYVGRAENIYRRWKSHHRMPQLSANPNARIVTIEHAPSELVDAEQYYINLLHPILNRTPVTGGRNRRQRISRGWPILAAHLAMNLITILNDAAKYAVNMGMQTRSIDMLAAHGVDLVRAGDGVAAIQMLQDIRSATAVQHHTAAEILSAAAGAAARIQSALVGKYE